LHAISCFVEAARRLGIHRQLLHTKIEKYGLGKRKSPD
jgi:hypothetical protein